MLQGSAAVLPPSGNTGVSVTSGAWVGVHWLTGTTFTYAVGDVLSRLQDLTGIDPVAMPRGARGYRVVHRLGPVVVFSEGNEDMGVSVEVEGEGCELLGFDGLTSLWADLDLRISRIDLAADGAPFTPAESWAAWTAGQVRTKVKASTRATAGREAWRSGAWMQNAEGDTATFGSPRSNRLVRVYDRRGTTRVELQVRKEAAEAVASDVFLRPVEELPRAILGHIRAFVDFVDVEADSNIGRAPLLPFWDAFCGHVEKAQVRLTGSTLKTFEKVDQWIRRQVAPSFAVWMQRMGPAKVEELFRLGRSRWTRQHEQLATGLT